MTSIGTVKNKVLIFDFDGVISDSTDILRNIIKTLQKKYKLPIIQTEEDFQKLYDKNIFDSLALFNLPKEQSQNLIEDFRILLQERKEKFYPFPGIINILRDLSHKYILIIISANPSQTIATFLKKIHAEKIFRLILGGEIEASKVVKIEKAIEQLNVSKNDVYYIGDTIGDMIEGREAGVKTVAVCYGYHDKKRLVTVSPDYMIENIRDFKNFHFI